MLCGLFSPAPETSILHSVYNFSDGNVSYCFPSFFFFNILLMYYEYYLHIDRARELADVIGGDALALTDLDNYHPEDDMILANTTSIGMQPKVDETPISKVCSINMAVISIRVS